MSFEFILYSVKDKIATVTINRPDVLNALNWKTMQELHEAFLRAKTSEEVGGVIITGSGEKSFVAGADIKELATKIRLAQKNLRSQVRKFYT